MAQTQLLKCSDKTIENLDPNQIQAVTAPLTNTCVFAVAGSGKTKVLTHRVANLIDNGINEDEILLLTFTNKASSEMISRIKKILNKTNLDLMAGTFHSVASLFLRKYSKAINISPNFDILDAKAQRNLMKNCRDLYVENYDVKDYEFPSFMVLTDIYSGAINHNVTFAQYIKEYYPYIKGERIDAVYMIFQDYVDRKESTNCLDFDDLLLSFFDLLKNKDVKKEINSQYKYVFVDEYQDINWIQYELLEELNSNNCLFVIGDSNQCIYQFRGSNDKYIDYFEETHENVNRYYLNCNYRSSPEILRLAENSINNNSLENPVNLQTINKNGEFPFIFGTIKRIDQFKVIAQDIKNNHYNDYKNVAILVRKGAEVEYVREALRTENIPAEIKGGNNLIKTRHFNDIYNILSFIENPANEVAMKYVFSMFGIYDEEAITVYKLLKKSGYKLDYEYPVSSQISKIIKGLNYLYTQKYSSVSEKIKQILDSFYRRYVYAKYPNREDVLDDIEYLANSSKKFKEIHEFIDYYILEQEKEKEINSENAVTIITMHKAKGLEWEHVYIPNLNKSEFPKARNIDIVDNSFNVQNERKLFYVAMTRAKKSLIMSYCMENDNAQKLGPSEFIAELNSDYYDHDFF